MHTSDADSLPADLATELESRFFWWEPVGVQPRSHARILAQAMDLASFADVRRLENTLARSPSVGRGHARGRAGMDQRAILGILARASGARYRACDT